MYRSLKLIAILLTFGFPLAPAQMMQQVIQSHAPSVAGSLSCSETQPSNTSYNLTTVGTTDWIMWNSTTVERDSSGGSVLSNYGTTGGAGTGYTSGSGSTFTWTNGTPDASDSSTGGLYISSPGWNFYNTCPAGTSSHTCKEYMVMNAGSSGNVATINAHLSDSSATDYNYTLTAGAGGNINFVVSCTYNAGSPSQTLTYTYTVGTPSPSSINVQAAAYQ